MYFNRNTKLHQQNRAHGVFEFVANSKFTAIYSGKF